eukprot:98903-Prymnesium_polylepis.1
MPACASSRFSAALAVPGVQVAMIEARMRTPGSLACNDAISLTAEGSSEMVSARSRSPPFDSSGSIAAASRVAL